MSDQGLLMKSTPNEEGASERLNVIASFFDCSLEQVKSIDTDIITRLNEKLIQFNELKSENLQITVSFDELKTNSLKKIDGLKTEMENVLRQNDEIRKERNDTSAKFEFLQNEKIQLSNELESVKRKLNGLTEEKKEIQSNQQRTLKILDERLKEVEMAKVENNRTNNECRKLRSTVVELETKQQTYITNDLNSRSELERKTQEQNLLQSNKDWLEKELSSKSEQYLSYRQRTDATISEIRSELNRLKNDFQLEKTNNDVLKQKNSELSNSLQEKVLDLKNLSDSLNTEKQEFSTEIALKQRLIDLLETQLNAVKEELKSIRKSDSSNVTSDDSRKLISENESLLKDLRLTKEKLAQCESECLRLSSITEETGGESGTLTSRSSTDFILLKKQYIKEKRAKEQLQNQIESFIVELEHKVPVINSFKERTDMLENELNNSALLLEHTSNEKNAKIRELNIKNEKIAKCENDIHILTRQRLDLCRQVQYLLITNSVSNDSKGPLRKEEIKFIQNILQNDNSGTTESDSQKILTGRLVEFRNVIELQERNTELLRITRNLADKLESNEIKSKQNLLKIENKTINEAKEAILSLQSEKMSLESKVEELERERETLKSSISKQASSFNNSVIQQLTKTKRELESQVQDLQARISQITRESTQNMSLLNKEIQDIYDSKSDISIELGKEKSSRILAEERFKLLSNTLDLTKAENDQLRKRSDSLQSSISKQDSKTHETLNEYISCKSKLSVTETALSNLKLEQKLKIDSEKSLKQELDKLSSEKTSLRIMVTQLQTLQKEREDLLDEARKSYQNKINEVEEAYNELKVETSHKDQHIMQLEEDNTSKIEWYQNKIETLKKDNDSVMNLVNEKQTEIEKLQYKAKSLEKEIQENKIRLHTYNVMDETINDDSLRKELEMSKINLTEAYSQIQEYKKLYESTAQSLREMNSKLDESNEAFSNQIQSLTDEKNKLEDKVSLLKEQSFNLNNELDLQKNEMEKKKVEFKKIIAILQNNNKEIETVKSEYESKLSKIQDDLDQQTIYANTAQNNYEQELQKHADVSKTISELREQLHTYRGQVKTLTLSRSELENILKENEKSWTSQKQSLLEQLDLSNSRIEDLSSQNKLLYNQIELYTAAGNGVGDARNRPTLNNDILVTLRRERDILDTKVTVAERDAKMLRQKITLMDVELQDARTKLNNSRVENDERSSIVQQHDVIMEKLNQLNLLRESNITLRNELENCSKKNKELQSELVKLKEIIAPIESELSALKYSMQEKEQEIRLAKEEVHRWKKRSQDILEKHQQLSSNDYEKLESEVESLKAQLEDKMQQGTEAEERFNRLRRQAQEKLKTSKLTQETLTEQLNELKDAKVALERSLNDANTRIQELEGEKVAEDNNRSEMIKRSQEDAEKSSRELQEKLEENAISYSSTVRKLNEEIATLKEEIEKQGQIQKQLQTAAGHRDEDLSNIVESMKKSFEEDKIKFIEDKTREVNKKIQEAQERLNQPSSVNIDEMKKQWEAKHEEEVAERIREAEEALKKRIRLPTEEKISKIIERKKEDLEKEFNEKLEEKVKSISGSEQMEAMLQKQLEIRVQEKQKELEDEYNEKLQEKLKEVSHSSSISVNEKDELRAEIEAKLREELNDELQHVKKKSFEEGKQQATMKTTLLERKLAKMESQLSEIKQSAESPPKHANNVPNPLLGLPRKIEENSNSPFNTLLSGEKLLKFNSKSSSSGAFNPFTSPSPKKLLQKDDVQKETSNNKTDPPTHLAPSFNIPATRVLTSSSSTLSTDTNDEELTVNEPGQKISSAINSLSQTGSEQNQEKELIEIKNIAVEKTKSNKRPIDEVAELKDDDDEDSAEFTNESKKIKTDDEEEGKVNNEEKSEKDNDITGPE
ncbi:hypothetical protein SKDZ_11G2980 [Saccharomyces kudriavzevii ZP591]|nr:hypothetical protein SKDZ_11G2980 [Saccharomyces kudriavzevii ZP591]